MPVIIYDQEADADVDEQDARRRQQEQAAQLPDMQRQPFSAQLPADCAEHEREEQKLQCVDQDTVQCRQEENFLQRVRACQEEAAGKVVRAPHDDYAQVPDAEEQGA